MKNRTLHALALSVGMTAVLLVNCSEKKKDAVAAVTTETPDGPSTATTEQLAFTGALNLIPPKELSSSALRLQSGSDYDSVTPTYYFEEESTRSLSTLSGITCFIGQTRFWEFLNDGPYIAMVNEDFCFGEKGGGDSGEGGAAAAAATNLATVQVDATREEGQPAKVRLLIPQDGGYFPVFASVNRGPSATNPVGIFSLAWGEGEDDRGFLRSSLSGNQISVQLYENNERSEDNGSSSDRKQMGAILTASGDSLTGKFSVYSASSYSNGDQSESSENTYRVAYNDSYIKRSTDTEDACLDRANVSTSVWRYSLFNSSDLSFVTGNSDVPILYESGENKYRGNLGYHGLWLPEDALSELEDGDTLYQIDWNDSSVRTPLTLVKKPGKLNLNTQQAYVIADLVDVPLNTWSESGNTRIVYNGTTFQKVATESCTQNNGCTWTDVTPTTHTLQTGHNGFWAEGLGSITIITTASTSTSASITSITGIAQTDVSTSAANLTLYCYRDCIKAGLTSDDLNGNRDAVYDDPSTPSTDPSSLVAYTWDAANLVLKRGGTTVQLPSGTSDISNDAFRHGIESGALVTATQLAELDSIEEMGATDHYRFRMGTQSWSQLLTVRKADDSFFEFSPPINFGYTHSATNDINGSDAFAGRKIQLTFSGQGNIYGIPFNRNPDNGRWFPDFSITAGATAGANNEYTLKPQEGSQQPLVVDSALCADLDNTDVPSFPDGTEVAIPVNDFAPIFDELTIKVIDGETQTGS